MPGNGIDDFVRPLAVEVQNLHSISLMDAAAAHGHQGRGNVLVDARQFKRVDAAIGQRQIDRPARLAGAAPRITPTFIQRYSEAASLQQNGEQCSRRARTDNVYGAGFDTHGRNARPSMSTAVNTSLYELYRGTGVRRKISGSRQSPITPAAVKRS
jgi:hypothetical protein